MSKDRRNEPTNYQRQLKGSGKSSRSESFNNRSGGSLFRERAQQRLEGDEIDLKFGFDRLKEGPCKLGWLLNYLPVVSIFIFRIISVNIVTYAFAVVGR